MHIVYISKDLASFFYIYIFIFIYLFIYFKLNNLSVDNIIYNMESLNIDLFLLYFNILESVLLVFWGGFREFCL